MEDGGDHGETNVEDEKEDAQDRLLDEFDEMMGLEERVRRLKERRETLRRGRAEAAGSVRLEMGRERPGRVPDSEDEDEDEEDEDDDDDEGGDDFFLRGR